MSTTHQRWLRTCATLAILVVLLAATSAADYVPATAPQPAGPTVRAPAAACTHSNPWQSAPTLNLARLAGATVVADGYMFALGGMVFWHEVSDVESAPIGADGTLGQWSTTTPLPSINQAMGAVAANGYVYVIGGWNGSQGLPWVQRAAVLPDGQLGAWEAEEALPDGYGRVTLSAVITGTNIYVLGGYNYSGTDVSRDVLRTTIRNDGTLTPWVATSSMLIGRRSPGAVIVGKFIYVVGGSELNNVGAGRSVERAEINSDGSLGAWQELAPLMLARVGASALVSGGYLYAISGEQIDFQSATNTVERAAIGADGSLGPWQYVDPLITATAGSFGASFNGRFYIVSGSDATSLVNVGEQVTAGELSLPSENGLTINDGALFTNQTAVSLTISGQPGTTQMLVSNDGGFAGAEWQDCVRTIPWTITQYGNSAIARVVYVKLKDAEGVVSGPYSDDIILDVVAPTGTVHMTPLTPAGARPAASDVLTRTLYLPLAITAGCLPAGCPPNVMLHLSASDDTSGVAAMQISTNPAFPGSQWQPFATSQAWYLPTGQTTVYARFRDNAGNVSSVVAGTLTP